MACRYCTYYQVARQRRWQHLDAKTRISERYCSFLDDWTVKLSKSCNDLILARYFYCDLRRHWVSVIACMSSRKTNRTLHCNNLCAQGKEVTGLCRGVNLFALHGGTPSSRNFKPKLNLRKEVHNE